MTENKCARDNKTDVNNKTHMSNKSNVNNKSNANNNLDADNNSHANESSHMNLRQPVASDQAIKEMTGWLIKRCCIGWAVVIAVSMALGWYMGSWQKSLGALCAGIVGLVLLGIVWAVMRIAFRHPSSAMLGVLGGYTLKLVIVLCMLLVVKHTAVIDMVTTGVTLLALIVVFLVIQIIAVLRYNASAQTESKSLL